MAREKKKVTRRAARILSYLNATSLLPTPEIVRREQQHYGFRHGSFLAEMFCDQRFAVDYTLNVLMREGLVEMQLLPDEEQVDLELRGGHLRGGWKLTEGGLRYWIQVAEHNRLPFFQRLLRPIPVPA